MPWDGDIIFLFRNYAFLGCCEVQYVMCESYVSCDLNALFLRFESSLLEFIKLRTSVMEPGKRGVVEWLFKQIQSRVPIVWGSCRL